MKASDTDGWAERSMNSRILGDSAKKRGWQCASLVDSLGFADKTRMDKKGSLQNI
ncbi:hypothetical protein [Bacillus sp. REN3]|uniref:hypothetical protein n=1 Tax=Bacillus sp. REN3 TaxID=2802440 RepID=UPI001AEE0494|nr:hypothetical protein [Bacillus sp. REN3]